LPAPTGIEDWPAGAPVAAKEFFDEMSLGPLMIDLQGPELTPQERELLLHPAVGGVILFSRNFVSPQQIQRLVEVIHRLRQPPLLVSVDQEGGRVQRFRDGFTELPPARHYGHRWRSDSKYLRRLARVGGWLMAAELRAVGVDFSFAPVLDIDRGNSQVIGDRSFHSRPEAVADLAHAFMAGMHEAGMAAVGKHFPGHGGVSEDSHWVLPVDGRTYADICAEDLVPFGQMIHLGVEAIMVAHVHFPRVDASPAGFSPIWLREVLRRELEFEGAIFSDDLSMAGARSAGSVVERAQRALVAGCDMVVICNDPAGASEAVEGVSLQPDPASQLRLLRMHGRRPQTRSALREDPRWHHAVREIGESQEHPTLDLGLE
jgi:beta-N-acetylhexosaminidase